MWGKICHFFPRSRWLWSIDQWSNHTHRLMCTSEETQQLGHICPESSNGWKCRDVPGAVVANPSGSSVFRSWLTWTASGPGGMSSFEELFFFWPIWLPCQQEEMAEVCKEGWTPAGWIGRGLKKHGVSPELLPLPWEGFKSPSHCAATLNLNTLGMAKEKSVPTVMDPSKVLGCSACQRNL